MLEIFLSEKNKVLILKTLSTGQWSFFLNIMKMYSVTQTSNQNFFITKFDLTVFITWSVLTYSFATWNSFISNSDYLKYCYLITKNKSKLINVWNFYNDFFQVSNNLTFADLIILITKYINVFTLLEKEQVFISYSDIHFFCIHICLEF